MRTWKHTQEQWWIDDDGFIAAGHDESYVTLADPHCSLDIDPDEREANSILMMLSPRMLSALVLAEDALSAVYRSSVYKTASNLTDREKDDIGTAVYFALAEARAVLDYAAQEGS